MLHDEQQSHKNEKTDLTKIGAVDEHKIAECLNGAVPM